ncbi:MAG: sigma-54-dependent Fis family transcriptional regulator [Deltaproteobacteria bacterium]|nr:sigma-54-dependent Fis family transcriptional regulator [Deltaproteobacteria bacterium]
MAKRILVADDDPTMRNALDEALQTAGYETVSCEDGADASQTIRAGGVDLVISDVRMPRINGLDLVRRSHEAGVALPFIMISGYATVPEAVEAMKMGVFDFLVKPFSYRELVSLVEAALTQDSEKQQYGELPKQDGKEIITCNPRMQALLKFAAQVARSQASVLIRGESGTGKELLARYIHTQSRRSTGPFVAVNCAALPEGLLESELFGYERGAFTGAVSTKFGKFELAHTGTLLLDEIGEIPLGLQPKLLRVLQEREVDRLGGKKPCPVDIRVIATTNKDLQEMVSQGAFREDLFYRLNVIPLRLPPLRERTGDVGLLASTFFCRNGYKKVLSPEAVHRLKAHPWRGNVRELFNVLERAAIVAAEDSIRPEHLFIEEEITTGIFADGPAIGSARTEWVTPSRPVLNGAEIGPLEAEQPPNEEAIESCSTVREMEKRLIAKVLDEVHGNRTQAAKLLGISVRTLRNKLRQYREES